MNELIKYATFICLIIAYFFFDLQGAERRKYKMENRIAKNRTSPKNENNYIQAYKELNPKAIVVAVGCYVQVARQELEQMPEIDLCIGTNEKSNVLQIIKVPQQ